MEKGWECWNGSISGLKLGKEGTDQRVCTEGRVGQSSLSKTGYNFFPPVPHGQPLAFQTDIISLSSISGFPL